MTNQTALEMLEALQAEFRGHVAYGRYHCTECRLLMMEQALAMQPAIDKLREEQTELVAAIESEPKLELRLFKIRQRLSGPRHAITEIPEEKHEHTPDHPDYCCSCKWFCTSGMIHPNKECARRHAEHVKEQK